MENLPASEQKQFRLHLKIYERIPAKESADIDIPISIENVLRNRIGYTTVRLFSDDEGIDQILDAMDEYQEYFKVVGIHADE